MNDKAHEQIMQMRKEEILLKLLQKEHGYYRVIAELTKTTNEWLKDGLGVNEVPRLLRKKKILLSCIEEIELALKPIKKYWKSKTSYHDKESQEINTLLGTLASLVKEITTLERENEILYRKEIARRKSDQETTCSP